MPYSISIDAIDLKYLPITNYFPKKKKTKLFDISSAKRHDYVEFEIFASKANDETVTGTILPYCRTICPICNITIPACYITEHNQSNKHKMYKSITDNALERVKKYLNEDKSVSDTKKLPDSYFCDVCCLAILESEKQLHEKSQNHCKALKKEEQLKDFLHLYYPSVFVAEDKAVLLDIDDDNSFLNNIVVEDIGGPENKFVLEFNDSEVNKVEGEIKSIVEPEVDKKKTRRRRKRDRRQLSPKVDSKSKVVDDVADAKIITSVEPKVEINVEPFTPRQDIVEIILTDGTNINVFDDQYNGFASTEDVTICLLCDELVSNKVAHKTSQYHLRFMKAPIKDTTCIRKIADNFNHCIICNEIFADVNSHLNSNELHHSRMHLPIGEHQNQTNSIFENMLNAESYKGVIVKYKRGIVKFPHYYHLDVTENMSTCKVCKVPVMNFLPFVGRHVFSIPHNNKYEEILNFNGLIKSNGYNFSCKYCNIGRISIGTELLHIDSNAHKVIFDIRNNISTKTQDLVSSHTIEPLSADIIKDIAAKPNAKLSAEDLPDMVYSTSVQTKVYCLICDGFLPNTLRNVVKHIQSINHKSKLMVCLDSDSINNMRACRKKYDGYVNFIR